MDRPARTHQPRNEPSDLTVTSPRGFTISQLVSSDSAAHLQGFTFFPVSAGATASASDSAGGAGVSIGFDGARKR